MAKTYQKAVYKQCTSKLLFKMQNIIFRSSPTRRKQNLGLKETQQFCLFSSAFSPTLFLRFSFDRRNVDPLGTDDVGGSEANGLSKRPGGVGGGVLPYISYIGMCRPIG